MTLKFRIGETPPRLFYTRKKDHNFTFTKVVRAKLLEKSDTILYHLPKATFVTMKLQGTANNLNAHFAAIPGCWLQMKEIFELLLTATKENPLSAKKMAACVNNEESTIFLGIDTAKPKNFILFHNLEVIPASRHQKEPIIRALHGLGERATVVTLNFEKIAGLNKIPCPAITNIGKFMGFDKINTGLIPSRTANLLKSTRGLIALPPLSRPS